MHAGLLQITIWLTPAGTVDEGGVEQPAYLNFDVALLGPPAGNQMEVRTPFHLNPGSLKPLQPSLSIITIVPSAAAQLLQHSPGCSDSSHQRQCSL